MQVFPIFKVILYVFTYCYKYRYLHYSIIMRNYPFPTNILNFSMFTSHNQAYFPFFFKLFYWRIIHLLNRHFFQENLIQIPAAKQQAMINQKLVIDRKINQISFNYFNPHTYNTTGTSHKDLVYVSNHSLPTFLSCLHISLYRC